MPRCSMTSARSPSICTSSLPTAAPGTRGMARCISRTASATAPIASTACTAPQQAYSMSSCSTAIFWTGSAAILRYGGRCSMCLPGSTNMLGCWANSLCKQTARLWRRNWAGIRLVPWPHPSTRYNASCWMGCAICSRKS
ncbi:hypothetical protein SDC9_163011 [bioreactor metagenome]|uniref:Uncharacterized protein n=1 Tax=bioreactor metagenome TaxID=1076179 RepID=A0A645FMP0_9ZZZZ